MSVRSLAIVFVAIALASTACAAPDAGGEAEAAPAANSAVAAATTVPTTTTTALPPTTLPPTTTTTLDDSCGEATAQAVAAFDGIFDRIDADPEGAIEALDESGTVGDLFGELGGLVADECGPEDSGEAISDIIMHLASEASIRTTFTQAFIEGMLPGFCHNEIVELSIPAKTVCATTAEPAVTSAIGEADRSTWELTLGQVALESGQFDGSSSSGVVDAAYTICETMGEAESPTALLLAVVSDGDPDLVSQFGYLLGAIQVAPGCKTERQRLAAEEAWEFLLNF